MKKITLVLLFMTIVFLLSAETMIVHTTTGNVVFEVSDINQITFDGYDGVDEDFIDFMSKVPIKFLKNYPNPFNPETTISFELNQQGQTLVEIYNVKGQKVKTLLNDELETGVHNLVWKGMDEQGQKVATGMYFYKVKVNKEEKINKMIMIK
jgi:hypothetical protein